MRYALVLPGRGSYTEASLGTLNAAGAKSEAAAALIARTEAQRAEYELPSLLELDAAERFSPAKHLRPANVSALIWLATMLDVEAAKSARSGDQLVAVCGNSMGWYTALAAGGALSLEDGFRLVQEVALLQEAQKGGGQLLYPLMDAEWRHAPELATAVASAVASSDGEAFHSIDLGGFCVLAASDQGLAHLVHALPPIEAGALGRNAFPLRLAQHGPYHTPLVTEVAIRAGGQLANLGWRRPAVTLVDGRGSQFTPWATSPRELMGYTLGHQITRPFDFTRSVRVVLRELAPERLVLPGPGNTLGSICGQLLVQEGWRGIRSRADFEAVQASREPILDSMRR